MGALIQGEDWLLDLALRDGLVASFAGRLLHAQIRLSESPGHILFFGSEHVRNVVVKARRTGKLPSVVVACQRCGCQALLNDWIRSATYTDELRAKLVERFSDVHQYTSLDFLRPCPGALGAADRLTLTLPESGD